MKRIFLLLALVSVFSFVSGAVANEGEEMIKAEDYKNFDVAILAGGCFWCMEPPFDKLDGVKATIPGYCGGITKNPTYEEVSSGTTGHAEVVLIYFDPKIVSYEKLLEVFWRNIDPTTKDRQFADVGTQYRTAIFYTSEEQRKIAEKSKKDLEDSGKFDDPIVTEITIAGDFYPAEDYHQEYYKKNPMRYNFYSAGSGRKDFIEETWGKEKK